MAFYSNRQLTNLASSVSVFAIAIGLVVGQSATQKSLAQTSTTPAPTGVTSINGAGASSVNTLFAGTGTTDPFAPKGSWFNTYGVGNPSSLNPPGPVNTAVTFRYASVGSGTGVKAFLTQTPPDKLNPSVTPTILPPVSFAATDDPLVLVIDPVTKKPILDPDAPVSAGPNSGVPVQVPVVSVGIALAYNPTGLNVPAGGIKLSRNTYLGILNGTITNWKNDDINKDNGGTIISVANKPIVVVYRSDKSGSTFTLTSHLQAALGAKWTRGVGQTSISGAIPNPIPADTVVWPATSQSASGGGGVADKIKSTPGAIGYVDSATRLAKGVNAAVLQNKAGVYNLISSTSIGNAFVGATDQDASARRIQVVVPDPTAANAYPIVNVSYALFYEKYAEAKVANGLKEFITWALGTAGDKIATDRGYAPLPPAIKTLTQGVVTTYVK